jgi:excinuclease ABC subunit C
MRMLEWIFPYRTCTRTIPENKVVWQRSCINEQLGKCPAPCIGKIPQHDYRKSIIQIVYFLKGKNDKVVAAFQQKMIHYSQKMQFEEAAAMRDKIENIKRLNRQQNMYFTDQKNRDVISIYQEDNKAAVAVLKIISGKLLNKEIYGMENVESESNAEILAAFLKQYYTQKMNKLPSQIILQEQPSDFETINDFLNHKLIIPHRGELKALQIISRENAYNYIEENKLRHIRKSSRTIIPVQELKEVLQLKKLPRKICCFDISTIQGTDTVASMVFFENGKPHKKNYRHFIINTVHGQDDYASLQEAISRFLAKLEQHEMPDLMVIDGGKGQLSSVSQIVKEAAPEIELIALAKQLEEIYLPHHKDSIMLAKTSSALRLLVRVRDEAHRFAVTFHRKRRTNRMLSSELDGIKGMGEDLKFLLLKEFGSIDEIKHANLVELMKIKGIGEIMARKIKESFLDDSIQNND